MMLSNWDMHTQTQPQTDTNFGYRILSAGDKPRLVTSLHVYSGTNTASATIGYMLLPSQPAASGDTYDLAAGAQIGSKVFHNTGNLSSGTSPVLGFSMLNDRGTANFGFIIPPQYILVAGIQDASLDGTIIHTAITADIDF